MALFRYWRFEPCTSGGLDEALEKIAVWFDGERFLHVAKQLENGWWSSKLGIYHDISHATNECLCGGRPNEYGSDPEFLARPRQQEFPLPPGIPDLGRL